MDQIELIPALGGRQSPEDRRDIPFAAVAPAIAEVLPDSYKPAWLDQLPIWYQRKLGACVGHAWAKARQKTELQETKRLVPISARFLYALAKSKDGVPGDSGTYPRLVAKILKTYGVCTELTFPNDTTLPFEEYVDVSKIPQAAYDEAKPYAIDGYSFVNAQDLNELKRAIIYSGENLQDIVMLVDVGKEWYTRADGQISWLASDILPLRPPVQVISGHEIYPTHFEKDPANGKTKIWHINSWSADWGDHGKGWFYYEDYALHIKEVMVAIDIPANVLDAVKKLPSKETFTHAFTRDIEQGERSDEVIALQSALMLDGEFDRVLYTELLQTNELGYYKPGGVTQAAVLAFQRKYKVASSNELNILQGRRVGAKTRSKLNELFNK